MVDNGVGDDVGAAVGAAIGTGVGDDVGDGGATRWILLLSASTKIISQRLDEFWIGVFRPAI